MMHWSLVPRPGGAEMCQCCDMEIMVRDTGRSNSSWGVEKVASAWAVSDGFCRRWHRGHVFIG